MLEGSSVCGWTAMVVVCGPLGGDAEWKLRRAKLAIEGSSGRSTYRVHDFTRPFDYNKAVE
jgi:hypothetical protein